MVSFVVFTVLIKKYKITKTVLRNVVVLTSHVCAARDSETKREYATKKTLNFGRYPLDLSNSDSNH